MIDNRMNMLMSLLSGNPQQIMQSNPQFNAILNQARQSGMSMKEFTMQYAKQNGIDINSLINAMQQRGFRF